MAEVKNLKVIIVGSGIGGAALAAAFQKDGVDFEIYDRTPSDEFNNLWGSSFTLQPTGVLALDDISAGAIVSEARKLGTSQDEGLFVAQTAKGRILGKPFERKDGKLSQLMGVQSGVTLRRADLHKMLLAGFSSKKLHLDHEVCEIDQDSDTAGVVVRFTNGVEARGDVVVGADGVRSTVRKFVSESAQLKRSYSWVGGHSPAGSFPPSLLPAKDRRLIFGRGDFPFFFAGCLPSGDVEWGAVVPENRPYSMPELINGYDGWAEPVHSLLKACNTETLHCVLLTQCA